jgi:hypothetical protein
MVIGIADDSLNMMNPKAAGIFSLMTVIMTGIRFPIEKSASSVSVQEVRGQLAYKPTKSGDATDLKTDQLLSRCDLVGPFYFPVVILHNVE